MKMGLRSIGTGLLAVGLLAGTVLAEGPGKERGKREKPEVCKDKDGEADSAARKEFRKAQRDRTKEFFDAQHTARQEAMQAVKNEEDAYKALALVRAHAVAQQEKVGAFYEAQWDRQMQFTSSMQEKNGIEQKHREKIMGKMVAEHEARKADAVVRQTGLLKGLDALAAKTDLTKEDLRSLLQNAEGRKSMHREKNQSMEPKHERKEGVKRERKAEKVHKPTAKTAAPDA